jgi:hypothetical protein
MVVVPKRRGHRWDGRHELIDSEWDDDDADIVLIDCRDAIDRHGVISLHPDGYASAQLQSPLICDPGDTDRPWRPLLPQLQSTHHFDLYPTPGHWAERRRARDQFKSQPPQELPPGRPPGRGEPPPTPPSPKPPRVLRTNGGGGPPKPFGPFSAPSLPEEPPLPEIEARDLQSALREFYRLYEGQGFSTRTKALYRSTVRKFLPGYQFPAHLR